MNIKKTSVGVAIALGLVCGTPAALADTTIDLFDTAGDFIEDKVNDGVADSTVANSAGGDIIGDQRDYSVEDVTSGADSSNAGTRIDIFNGNLDWSVDSGAEGVAVVQWDGAADAGSMALNYDLTNVDLSGDQILEFDINNADLGFDFEIGFYNSINQFTSIALRSDSVTGGPDTRQLFLKDWTNPANCLFPGNPNANPGEVVSVTCGAGNNVVDLSDVKAIQLTLTSLQGSGSVDLSINAARTVPTPGVLALMGLGLAAGGFVSRRRARKA